VSERFSTTGLRISAGNSAAAVCVIQGMEDLVVDGFLWLGMEAGEFLVELVSDLWDVARECPWPDARAGKERLVRLRRWHEQVERSLERPAAIRFRV